MGKPNLIAQDVFTTCISRVRDPNLKRRLTNITNNVVTASNQFDNLATTNQLHRIGRQVNVGGVITKRGNERRLYPKDGQKNSPGRDAYDLLFNSAVQGKCPLCAQRIVSTLDRRLPKAHYPALAVTPLNLVPACSDCNKAKLANLPTTSSEETLHPYYDYVERAPVAVC